MKCYSVQCSDMAEKEATNGQATVGPSTQSVPALPSAGTHSSLQDMLNLTSLDSSSDEVVQPFPRSPSLQRKMANAAQPSQVQENVADLHNSVL